MEHLVHLPVDGLLVVAVVVLVVVLALLLPVLLELEQMVVVMGVLTRQ
jgi:hypothetical protein